MSVINQINNNKMNIIELENLELQTFTEQDVVDYCQINNLNPDNITELWLRNNELTDISGIKEFKNLEELYLFNNKLTDISIIKIFKNLRHLNIGYNLIKDISVIKYLNNLKYLNIKYLELESDQIQYINSLKKLEELLCKDGFKKFKEFRGFKHRL